MLDDIVLKKGTEIMELIQVAYNTGSPDAEQREAKALFEAGAEVGTEKLTVITWDEKKEVKKDNQTVRFVPLWEWLINLQY